MRLGVQENNLKSMGGGSSSNVKCCGVRGVKNTINNGGINVKILW